MPGRYPYVAQDRLYALPLDADLSSNPGTSPPSSIHSGTATLGKFWLDTSTNPPTLRICAVATASPGYAAGDWSTFGPLHAGGVLIDLSPYMPLAGNSTKTGSLTIIGGLTVNGDVGISGAQGITYSTFTGGGSDNSQHRYRFGWTGTNLVVSVDSTGGLQLANANQLGNYLPLSGGTLTGLLSVTTGNSTSISTSGEIISSHSLATGGYVWINGCQWSNNQGYMYTGSSLWTSAQSRADGGGSAFYAPNGNLEVGGVIQFGGLQLSNYQGWIYSGSGIRSGSALESDISGTALYAPNGDLVIGGIATIAGHNQGNLAIHCTSGAVQSDLYGSAIYTPNGNVVTNDCFANNFINTSDAELKTGITTSKIGLDVILGLAPKAFRWKSAPEKEQLGLIAQEVQEILPQAVSTTDGGGVHEPRMGIDYAAITTALVGAIQQLKEEIDELKGKK